MMHRSASISTGNHSVSINDEMTPLLTDQPLRLSVASGLRTPKVWKARENVRSRTMAQCEILDILGLLRDTAYRDYTRELSERGASLEQIYGTLRSRMNARLSA